jgi:hypothetical protein
MKHRISLPAALPQTRQAASPCGLMTTTGVLTHRIVLFRKTGAPFPAGVIRS